MIEDAIFSSLPVSRPDPDRGFLLRAGGLAAALGLHVAVLACVLVAPFVVLEVMAPPEATPLDIILRPPGARGMRGDGPPPRATHLGTGGGARREGETRDRKAATTRTIRPDRVPVAPPEPNPVSDDEPAVTGPTVPERPAGGPPGVPGDPGGNPDGPHGPPGGCKGCSGTGEPDGPWGPFGPEVLGPAAPGVVQPVLISASRALPAYPDAARRARVEGVVVLMIVILADGSVGEIDVIRAPDPLWGFDLAAIQAVKHWRYRPALMHGRPVAVYAHVVVEFILSR